MGQFLAGVFTLALLYSLAGLIFPGIFFWNKNSDKKSVVKQGGIVLVVSFLLMVIVSVIEGPKNQSKLTLTDVPQEETSLENKDEAQVAKEEKEEIEEIIPLSKDIPERELGFYINAIMQGDWETVFNHTQLTWRSQGSRTDLIKQLKNQYGNMRIKSFKIKGKTKDGEAFKSFIVQLVVNQNGKDTICEMRPNLICEIGVRKPDKNGDWGSILYRQ